MNLCWVLDSSVISSGEMGLVENAEGNFPECTSELMQQANFSSERRIFFLSGNHATTLIVGAFLDEGLTLSYNSYRAQLKYLANNVALSTLCMYVTILNGH